MVVRRPSFRRSSVRLLRFSPDPPVVPCEAMGEMAACGATFLGVDVVPYEAVCLKGAGSFAFAYR